MSYQVEPLIFTNFKGIREYNGVNANGEISAISSYNVELFASDIGSGVGIKSMPGNARIYQLPTGYKAKGIFKSNQFGKDYVFIYAENDTIGSLFYIDETLSNPIVKIIDILTKTGECNALTMCTTAYDVFVFTNGDDIRTICFPTTKSDRDAYLEMLKSHNTYDEGGALIKDVMNIQNITKNNIVIGYIASIKANDVLYTNKPLKFIAMEVFEGSLVVANEFGVRGSCQNDIYDWSYKTDDSTSAWYIESSKKVTALASFTGGLYYFTSNDVTYLSSSPNNSSSVQKTAGMNGCMDYKSLVKHDTFLFFYDDNQKNIFYLGLTDTGQTRPTGPVAKEIQSHFQSLTDMKMFSCIYGTRNEIWCKIDDKILILDYTYKEWTVKQSQQINWVDVIENHVYSCSDNGMIIIENKNNDYANGKYYPSFYQTTYINANSNTNIKKQKTPLLITVNDNYINKFKVQLIIDYKEKAPKTIELPSKNTFVFADENTDKYGALETNTLFYDEVNEIGGIFPAENTYSKKVVEVSTPQTWYTMSVRIYTENVGDGFYINSMELKNIKAKTKTKGR